MLPRYTHGCKKVDVDLLDVHADRIEKSDCDTVSFAQQTDKDVLRSDLLRTHAHRFGECVVKDLACTGCKLVSLGVAGASSG